jgi:hypothetical protein
MSLPGGNDLMVAARRVLLDALTALADHRDALILIGAQAIYLHTGAAPVALPEFTKDSDIAIDRRRLADDPLLEEAMSRAGFTLGKDPGSWRGALGIPVDLMVPESMSDAGGRRGGRLPPHAKRATRRASGLEAAIVNHAPMTIAALDPADHRSSAIEVAGPAALLVAKLHKLGDRDDEAPDRSTTRTPMTSIGCWSPSTPPCSRGRSRCCWQTTSRPGRPVPPSSTWTTSS